MELIIHTTYKRWIILQGDNFHSKSRQQNRVQQILRKTEQQKICLVLEQTIAAERELRQIHG